MRERQTDLLLTVLRDFLAKFKGAKLVLLSSSTATISLLTSYFTSCHILHCALNSFSPLPLSHSFSPLPAPLPFPSPSILSFLCPSPPLPLFSLVPVTIR